MQLLFKNKPDLQNNLRVGRQSCREHGFADFDEEGLVFWKAHPWRQQGDWNGGNSKEGESTR